MTTYRESLRARIEAATPWKPSDAPFFKAAMIRHVDASVYGREHALRVMEGQYDKDGLFIAHARTDLPKLLALLERAEKALEEITRHGTTGDGNTVECEIAYQALAGLSAELDKEEGE